MSGLFAAIDRLLECKSEIKNWFEEQRKNTPIPFYGSFDIRDAGWKVVVVDSNAVSYTHLTLPTILRV